jgi:hypothetical protein
VAVTSENYEKLKEFWMTMLHTLHPRLFGIEEGHPAEALAGFEATSPSLARKSLQTAIGDILEQTAHFSASTISNIDNQLTDRGLPTLSAVRLTFWKRIATMMERGRIRSEAEYHLLKNVADSMDEADKIRAWSMIDRFGIAGGDSFK